MPELNPSSDDGGTPASMPELTPSSNDGGTPPSSDGGGTPASMSKLTPSSTWRRKPSQKGKPRFRLVKHATPKRAVVALRKKRKAGAGVDGERPQPPVRRKLDLDGERRPTTKIITEVKGRFRMATLKENLRVLAKLYFTGRTPRTPPPPKIDPRSCFVRAQLKDNLRSLAVRHNLIPAAVAAVTAAGKDAKGKNKTKKPMMVDELVMVPYSAKRAATTEDPLALVLYDGLVPRWTTVALTVKPQRVLVQDITPAIEAAHNALMRLEETCRDGEMGDIPESLELDEERKELKRRVEHFMAEVRKIIGERNFDNNPWKGTVVTSVVGTFLTQNVTDNMSSNAFMNIAAKFSFLKNGSNVEQSTSVPLLTYGCDAGSADERGNCRDKGIEELIASLRTGEISNWDKERIKKVLHDRFEYSTADKIYKDIASIGDTSHWNSLVKEAYDRGYQKENTDETIDWEALLHAPYVEIEECIRDRGNQSQMAFRILAFLIRIKRDHGSIDLEWLRHVPRAKARRYLRSINGLGEKSVDCVRLLSLRHRAFPVDTNVARIVTRLGWVKLQPLQGQEFHMVNTYPVMADIQKYLEPLLCKIPTRQVIDDWICTKRRPNCGACPFRGECKYFDSLVSSQYAPNDDQIVVPAHSEESASTSIVLFQAKGALPEYSQQHEREKTNMDRHTLNVKLSSQQMHQYQIEMGRGTERNCEPFVEMPESDEESEQECDDADDIEEHESHSVDIEDIGYDVVIDLRATKPIENVNAETGPTHGKEIFPSQRPASSTPMIKRYRLRTVYTAYEIPDGHEILDRFDPRVPGDRNMYLLIIRSFLDEHTVSATILIPCLTANEGVFPLLGTYFQENEVFTDHSSSRSPIEIKRKSIWPLKQCTVAFGTSIHSVSKEQTLQELTDFFHEGYICNREFDRNTRRSKALSAQFHATNGPKGSSRKRSRTYSGPSPGEGNGKDGTQSVATSDEGTIAKLRIAFRARGGTE